MKNLILIVLVISSVSSVFAAEKIEKFDCGVKSLTSSSPKDLRVGDSIRVSLSSAGPGVESQKISTFQIAHKTVKGNAKLSPSGGAYPDVYIITGNNRMILTFEVSKSHQNARIRSLGLSGASSGFPVIATLSCVQTL